MEVTARGYCKRHYHKLRKYGDANAETPPRLRKPGLERFWPKVDKTSDPNGCWLWTAAINKQTGYGAFQYNNKIDTAHRVSYMLHVGPIPEDTPVIDHKCHVRRCVNPSHLRAVTQQQNLENLSGPQVGNTTGFLGVGLHRASGKYRSRVKVGGVEHSAGYHATPELANEAIVALRNKLLTHNDRDRD